MSSSQHHTHAERALPGRTLIAVAVALALSAFAGPVVLAAPVAAATAEASAAQDADVDADAADAAAEEETLDTVTVVSARKRDELIVDIPVSVSAVSAGSMERRGLRSVFDIAPSVPGLNINSDSAARAFVSIRGIGTALQAGVQPGVGVFQDGIYVRETSYINNPLLEIDHIEVLRGPQGTLYGKNTLGGAINIITRPPGDAFGGRIYGSYSEGNDTTEVGGSLEGGISETLKARLSFATRDSDGFYRNNLTGDEADATSSDQANLNFLWSLSDSVLLTSNTYFLDFEGPGTNYNQINGPTDYRYNLNLNQTQRQDFEYFGSNAKLTFPVGESTFGTAIVAYDSREQDAIGDGDFLPLDVVRTSGTEDNDTLTGELRFDTQFSDTLSGVFGLFGSHETVEAASAQRVVPANRTVTTFADRKGDTYAAFGTLIWRFSPEWEFSAGLRFDHEDRRQDISMVASNAPTTVIVSPRLELDSDEIQPRVSLTRFFEDSGWMAYGSIAKGYRGGGFNSSSVPAAFLVYDGDTVWTYEVGSKFASADQRTQFTIAGYYNDYTDFIGQNALARGPGGGLVSIDLNLGDVESYGVETELVHQLSDQWTLRGNLSLMHARITDQSGWVALTGARLATTRLLFQPDYTAGISSDFSWDVGAGDLDWTIGATAKGSRPGSSFDPVNPSILENYLLVNTALTWRGQQLTVGAYVNNLFDEDYFESYIDGSLLSALGLLDQNLGILGAGRNGGVRVQWKF